MAIPDFIPLDQFRNLDWMSSRFPRPDRASYIKALEQSISDINALLGTPEGDRNMGVFSGDILPDNATLKVVLQELENTLSQLYSEAPVVASGVEAQEGTDNHKIMTPLRVAQVLEERSTKVKANAEPLGIDAETTSAGSYNSIVVPGDTTFKSALSLLAAAVDGYDRNLDDFGGIGSGAYNNNNAILAALAADPNRVVNLTTSRRGAGRFLTNTSFYGYLNCRFTGSGQLVMDGKGQARDRAFITNEVVDPDYNTLENYFDGDWSKQISTRFTFVGQNVGITPITQYRLLDRASQEANMFVNAGGANTSTGNQSGGRTGIFREATKMIQGGQGDLMARYTNFYSYSARAGATHFLANPAVSLDAADWFAGADGGYYQHYEVNFHDNGYAIAVGSVSNYDRTNSGNAQSQTWKHRFVNSRGTQPIDIVYQAIGLIRCHTDVSSATLTNGCAFALKADQRIYYDVTPVADPIGVTGVPLVSDTWQGYDSATSSMMVSLAAGKKFSIKNPSVTLTADPTAWATPALSNSWVANTSNGEVAPQYRRDMGGKVVLRGHASGGADNTAMFTLPIGYRPPYRMRFAANSLGGLCTITIDPDGVVFVLGSAGYSPKYVGLDGISFELS